METRRRDALLYALATAMLVTTSVNGSSSLAGPPGRADSANRKVWNKTTSKKTPPTDQPAPETPAPAATPVPAASPDQPQPTPTSSRTRFVWAVPSTGSEKKPESNKPSQSDIAAAREPDAPTDTLLANQPLMKFPSPEARAAAYEQVLTPRQRTVLYERSVALSLSPHDYEHLLSEDEQRHVETEIAQRKRRVATQE